MVLIFVNQLLLRFSTVSVKHRWFEMMYLGCFEITICVGALIGVDVQLVKYVVAQVFHSVNTLRHVA